MSTEKFSLRWNDFEGSISSSLGELRETQDFLDVTIVCENEQIRAHKLILSACSPFFRNILVRNPHQNPLLFLKGINFVDIKTVLDFMYFGEVSIEQENLNSFLAVAEDLQVKGLTQKHSNEKQHKNNSSKSKLSARSSPQKHTYERINQPSEVYVDPSTKSMPDNQLQSSDANSYPISTNIKTEQTDSSQRDDSQSVTKYQEYEDEYTEDDYTNYDGDDYYDNSHTLDLSVPGNKIAILKELHFLGVPIQKVE